MEKVKTQQLNILMVSLYPFKKLSDGYIAADLVSEFTKHGHKMTVIAPHEGHKGVTRDDSEGFANVRIGSGAIQKTGAVKKVLNLRKLDKATRKYLKDNHTEKFDLVICMISHCAFYKTVKFIKNRDDAFVYNMVKDIFPQNAVDMGMMKKGGIVYKFFKGQEDKYYQTSDVLGALSPKGVDMLREFNPKMEPERIELCPNSCVPTKRVMDSAERKKVLQKHGLPTDKVIFIYGGNLGKPQGLDFLLECIKRNEEGDGKACFVVIGNGTELEKVRAFFADNNIKNSILKGRISSNDFDELCMASDVGLVLLAREFTVPNYPSRVLSYMQARIPILFAGNQNCDMGENAVNNNYGFSCINRTEDVAEFMDYVKKMTADAKLRKKMGENAYTFMCDNYAVSQTYDIIIKHLQAE